MNNTMKVILSISLLLIVLISILSIISHTVYHRSLAAAVIEKYLKIINTGKFDSVEAAERYMAERAKVEDEPFKLTNSKKYASTVKVSELGGMKAVALGEKESSDYIVIYIHGGAYVDELASYHLNFCDKLSQAANCYVIASIYPLAPNHTYKETYELLLSLYRQVQNNTDKEITIMGDSSGGGLAVAFCEYLKELELKQPDHLIAFSPWLDVSMSCSDYSQYVQLDPMLGVDGIVRMGKSWAGELATKNYKVSPFYGDVSGLPDTTLFVGTREIFYPHLVQFYEKLKSAGVDVELHIGENMNHIYPLYLIPEAKEVLKEVCRVIGNKKEDFIIYLE